MRQIENVTKAILHHLHQLFTIQSVTSLKHVTILLFACSQNVQFTTASASHDSITEPDYLALIIIGFSELSEHESLPQNQYLFRG